MSDSRVCNEMTEAATRAGTSRDSPAFPLTGAESVARTLKAAGVTRVFALCGDHVNSLFHAASASGIGIVGTRHESAAVQMADGWARTTGQPGVAIVTGGPGHTNAITGAAVAQHAQSPVLVISGQAAKARRERGGNQSLHQADIMRPVTKWAIEAESSAGLGELVARALAVAKNGTPGAVSLSIPVDVADAGIDAADASLQAPVAQDFWQQPARATLAAAADAIDEAAKLLRAARRPVLVLGGNPFQHAPYDMLGNAVRRLQIPAFTNGHARGVIPDDGELCFGFASPLFNRLFSDAGTADLWLLVGTSVDYNIARVVSPAAKVIQIHHDAQQLGVGRLPTHALLGTSATTLAMLADALAETPGAWIGWRDALRKGYQQQSRYWEKLAAAAATKGDGVHAAGLCVALREHWTPDSTLVVDVGDFVNWPKAYFPALRPSRYMDGGALGNLGGALPVGIGAQFARKDHPVWVFIGDGGLGFHGWELSVAAEHELPLKVFVGNDRAWGTEKRLQRSACGMDIACDLPAIRYDRFADLQNVRGFHVSTHGELAAVIPDVMSCRGPCLVNVETPQLAGRPFAGVA